MNVCRGKYYHSSLRVELDGDSQFGMFCFQDQNIYLFFVFTPKSDIQTYKVVQRKYYWRQ